MVEMKYDRLHVQVRLSWSRAVKELGSLSEIAEPT